MDTKFIPTDPDSDYMDNYIELGDIQATITFFINFYIKSDRKHPEKTRFDAELLEKVNPNLFNQQQYFDWFKKVGNHIKSIIPNAEIYGNFEKDQQVGEFSVFSFAFGSPNKTIFFTNVDNKRRFPSLSSLYYMIVGILTRYDDFETIQQHQKAFFESKFFQKNFFDCFRESVQFGNCYEARGGGLLI